MAQKEQPAPPKHIVGIVLSDKQWLEIIELFLEYVPSLGDIVRQFRRCPVLNSSRGCSVAVLVGQIYPEFFADHLLATILRLGSMRPVAGDLAPLLPC